MKTITRAQAIADLRSKLVLLVDEEHSLCEVTGKMGIFCKGFSRWKSHELKQRYDWIAKTRPGVTRKELEELANRWQLVRQSILGTTLPCDTEALEHRSCKGWDEFTDAELAGFHREICGEEVQISPAKGVA